jgi:hypothetical protein
MSSEPLSLFRWAAYVDAGLIVVGIAMFVLAHALYAVECRWYYRHYQSRFEWSECAYYLSVGSLIMAAALAFTLFIASLRMIGGPS